MSVVDWVLLGKDAVQVGDFVSAAAGGMPIYRVVKVEGGQVWLQDDGHLAARPMPLDSFLWKASGSTARAA